MPGETRTWVVMVHGTGATVLANNNTGGVLTRIQRFGVAQPEGIAQWLDDARSEGAFERLMLVAAASSLEQLERALPASTRALLAATRIDDLSAVPPESMREHVPEAAWR